jgi:NADH-quinone oxidoreductase subunit L
VAVIGAATALMAATIGLAQTDIKKVLAYSTVSQLGYMFLAAGVGAYSAAIFHLGTHAFFKALLFLGSGSVIHAMSGEQDMRSMGGLKSHLPTTYRTFLIATIAIAGIPPLAGFFSKDEILAGAFAGGHYLLWTVGLLTAGLTACYMFRAVYLTFFGKFRGTHEQEHHLHESPAVMTVPLMILAIGAIGSGWLGLPGKALGNEHLNWIHHFLAPVIATLPAGEHAAAVPPAVLGEHHLSLGLEWGLMLVSVAVAVIGILIARRLWGGDRGLQAEETFAAKAPAVQRTLQNKYWVDELYDALFVRPLVWLSDNVLYRGVDAGLIDGAAVNGSARLVRGLASGVLRHAQSGLAQGYLFLMVLGTLAIAGYLVLG